MTEPSHGMLHETKHTPSFGYSSSRAQPASAAGSGHTSAGMPKFSAASRYGGVICWSRMEQRNTGSVCAGRPIRFGKPAMISQGTSSSNRTIFFDRLFSP